MSPRNATRDPISDPMQQMNRMATKIPASHRRTAARNSVITRMATNNKLTVAAGLKLKGEDFLSYRIQLDPALLHVGNVP